MISVTPTRILRTLAFATAGPAVAAGSAAAEESLNPPPPSWYTGSGTVCHRKMTFENLGGFDGTCPQGFSILENGHHEKTGTRYYDRHGNLTRRVLHDVWPVGHPLNVLYNSQTGKSVPYRAASTAPALLAAPGDLDSATTRITGTLYTVTLPGGGLLVHDVGVFTFAPDGSIIDHGPKMLSSGRPRSSARRCRDPRLWLVTPGLRVR